MNSIAALLQNGFIPTLQEGGAILVFAIIRDDLDLVEAVLKVQPKAVEVADDDGDFPLHWAVMSSIAVFQKIFEAAPEIAHSLNKNEESPLFKAVWEGNLEKVRLLLSVNPQAAAIPNMKGETPLSEAIFLGSREIARELLVACPGAVRVKNMGQWIPIYYAISCFYKSSCVYRLIVLDLIEAWPQSLRERDYLNRTPREYAAAHDYMQEIVELLEAAETNLKIKEAQLVAWSEIEPLLLSYTFLKEKPLASDASLKTFLHHPLMDKNLLRVVAQFLFPVQKSLVLT